jgi:hypothetical protein
MCNWHGLMDQRWGQDPQPSERDYKRANRGQVSRTLPIQRARGSIPPLPICPATGIFKTKRPHPKPRPTASARQLSDYRPSSDVGLRARRRRYRPGREEGGDEPRRDSVARRPVPVLVPVAGRFPSTSSDVQLTRRCRKCVSNLRSGRNSSAFATVRIRLRTCRSGVPLHPERASRDGHFEVSGVSPKGPTVPELCPECAQPRRVMWDGSDVRAMDP